MNYQQATLDEIAVHFKTASRQIVAAAKSRYSLNSEVYSKLERAYVMARIARLQDELEALDNLCKKALVDGR